MNGAGVRGVLLAGGTGSRLGALTRVTNKHLLPVGSEPMLCHPLRRIIQAGVEEIMVVTGTEHAGAIFQFLGSGHDLGCHLTYRVQDRPDGIAGALALARDFVGGAGCLVVLGDNIFAEDLTPHVGAFVERVYLPGRGPRGLVLLAEVDRPERYGVAEFDGDALRRIHEKPATPPSNLAVTGCYLYAGGSELFGEINRLQPSARGEREISDLNNVLLARGALSWRPLHGAWTDAGTPESLRAAQALVSPPG